MALNTSLPLRKSDGSLPEQLDLVRVSRFRFRYRGAAATLYICIGLKDGSGSFNQGSNLLGGPSAFAAVPFQVPLSRSLTWYTIDIPARSGSRPLLSLSNTAPNVRYGTYVWISKSDSARDDQRVTLLDSSGNVDTDSGVVQTLASVFEDTVAPPPEDTATAIGDIHLRGSSFPALDPLTGAIVVSWTVQLWRPEFNSWLNSPRGYLSKFEMHVFTNRPLKDVIFRILLRLSNGDIKSLGSVVPSITTHTYGLFTFVDGQTRTMDMSTGKLL